MRRKLLIPVLVGLLIAPLGALPATAAVELAPGNARTAVEDTPPDRIIDEQEPRLVQVTEPAGTGEQPPPAPREGTPVVPGGDEVADDATQLSAPESRALGQLAGPLTTFDGMGGANPNDTTGDVGPNHFVQAINSSFRVYDKAGTSLEGPTGLGQLWNDGDATTEACEQNAGDPVVLYDNLADRWMIAQFSRFAPFRNIMCLAVSVTADPRLSQGYYAYTFDMGAFPDYLKIGAWTDGYYFSANGDGNALVAVFDRASMLNGVPAGAVQFNAVADLPNNNFNVLMPSDIDGSTAPPVGSPGYFYRPVDGDNMGGGADRVELFTATVNWADPAASTLSAPTNIALVAFDSTVCGYLSFGCIPQPGTSGLLDPVNEPGMFRFPYRNYGDREVLVGNFTVDTNVGGADRAGVRWFVLERTGGAWGVADQGTFAPQPVGATAFVHRFMGSVAMDRFGNLALGYTRSSADNPTSPGGYTGFASAVYTGRTASDPAGLLPQPEFVVQDGTGALGASGADTRWGDYYTMVVDPVDDCTFWYTGDYATTLRQSRVASFRFSDCATDLRITKAVAPSQTGAGQQADYTITVYNDGAVGATNVVVTDPLPAEVTYQSDTDSCTGVAVNATGTLTCTLGNIAAGESKTFQVKVRINENPGTTTITNTATVTGGPGESDPSNNTASVTHFVTGANLSLTKSDSPDPVIAGENLVYTLAVDNAGPQTADSTVVTDTLPPGVTFVSAAPTIGTATQSGGVVTWNLGNVDPDDPVRNLTVTVKVNPQTTGSLTNSATVTSSTADPDASNNLASSTTAVTAVANLTLTKSDSPDPVIAGNNLSYTLTLGNSGPSTARDVVLTDPLPAGVSFVSAVGGTGATACAEVTPGVVSCAVGDLDPGQTVQRIITVKVNASLPAGNLSNTATASSPTDADGAQATATTTTTTSADLWMEKKGTASAGNPSGAITYRLTVHNETGSAPDSTPTSGTGGPSDAQSVVVVDTLPLTSKKLTVQFLSPGCTYSAASHTVTCTAATVPAGSSVTFEIQVQISGSNGSLTNTARVSSATTDPTIGNNTDSVNNVVQGGSGKGPKPR
ncbi:MAG: DUF11 domain-containing protein [Mycetocola sp.]